MCWWEGEIWITLALWTSNPKVKESRDCAAVLSPIYSLIHYFVFWHQNLVWLAYDFGAKIWNKVWENREWSGRVQYRSKISWFLYFKWQRQSYWVLDSFGLQRYSLAWNGWYPHPLCYSSQWIWIFITPRKSSFRRPIFCSGTLELIDQSRLSFLLFDFDIQKA